MTDAPHAAVERLRVALGERGYDILVGPGLIETAGEAMLPLLRRRQAVVVTDEQVARHYLAALCQSLDRHGITHHAIVLPSGEGTKDLAHFGRLVDDVLGSGIERGTMLIALGGGVVGDITGFAAATLLRGIDFVQIPTTLLAQVDSSVGGKTAINTAAGKNLLGAFYQPRLVLADTASLRTLPRREVRAGYAEIVKYGLIRDARFFEWLETEGGAVCDLEPAALTRAVIVSCRMKAEIVAADERETGDERALLNFGHTFGHALEAETGFGDRLLHGEAVALGMALAFDFAVRLGLASGQDAHRVRRHLAASGLPTTLAEIGLSGETADRLLAHMSKDKKVRDGAITLILPRRIGDCFVMRQASREQLREFLSQAHDTIRPRTGC
jgi:3-dehydroquinate synthase